MAILFAADEPLTVAELARLLEVRPTHVNRIARRLAESPPPGLLLQRDDDRFQLVTAPSSARYIRRLRGLEEQARLSRAALEVLAVVAYRQPATRAEIEAIRGVNGDRALSTLLARGLISEVGRRETVGRPVEFGTTLGFLEHLGLRSLDDLPAVPTPDPEAAGEGDGGAETREREQTPRSPWRGSGRRRRRPSSARCRSSRSPLSAASPRRSPTGAERRRCTSPDRSGCQPRLARCGRCRSRAGRSARSGWASARPARTGGLPGGCRSPWRRR